jgi:hypothetical protein
VEQYGHTRAGADIGGARLVHLHVNASPAGRINPQERGPRSGQIPGIGESLRDLAVERSADDAV